MATQTVKIEIEVEADLSGVTRQYDFGVADSPIFVEQEDVDYMDGTIEILGHRVEVAVLPKALRDDILSLLADYAKDDAWEE